MLLGQYEVNLTDKGRLALPKKFREAVGGRIIVARWYEGCLVVVAQEMWTNLLEKLTSRSQFVTQPVRDTDRFILGSAFEVDLDKQGRFVVPKYLLDYAQIKKTSVFLGLKDRIEIWDQAKWLEREKFVEEHASEMIETLAKEI